MVIRLGEAVAAKEQTEARDLEKFIQALKKDIEERSEKLKAMGKLEQIETRMKSLLDLAYHFLS